MDRLRFLFNRLLAMTFVAVVIVSCDKDEDPPAPADLTLSTFTAGSIDLNGATAPNNVPVDATFTVTFNTNVDAATATESNITLTRNYDDTDIPLTISTSGATVTITPEETLGTGTQYTFNIGTGLASTDGKALTSAIERSFTTEGTFAPAGVVAHFTFEDAAEDIVGDYDPASADVVAISYSDSRNAAAGKAATFDGDASIIEIPNGPSLLGEQVTFSYWIYLNSEGHVDAGGNPAGNFIMGLGNFRGIQFEVPGSYAEVKVASQYGLTGDYAGQTAGGDLIFRGDGITKDNGGFIGTEVSKDLSVSGGVAALIKDKWAHIVFVYDGNANTRSLYINGELMHRDNLASLATSGEPGLIPISTANSLTFVPGDWGDKLALGFVHDRSSTEWSSEPWGSYALPTSNHFKGMLDDLRIFNVAVTDQEIQLMYNSEKP